MKRIVTSYDMMICSPCDTTEEVEAIFESVMDFNRIGVEREESATMIRIVAWNRDVFMNSNKTIQESVNEQIIEQCDFAVVVFKHRLGERVGTDESGTAQEIRLLQEKHKQVFIFCMEEDKETDLPIGKNEKENKEIIRQFRALKKFICKLKKANIPIQRYSCAADLRNRFFNQLRMYDLLKNMSDFRDVSNLGIVAITTGCVEQRKLCEKIENARSIKIFTTTGNSLFHSYTSCFAKMLRNNGNLQVLMPNPESEFLRDVDLLESRGKENSVSKEFHSTIENLGMIWREANSTPCSTLGKIQIACSRTMLRQTEIICIDKENENDIDDKKQIWCWVTVTMPPKRASGDSLSIECQAFRRNDGSLADWANTNFNRSWEESSAKIVIDDKMNLPYFYMEKPHAMEFWKEKLEEAKTHTNEARCDNVRSGILIEVAAQHPLKNDGTPGEEFAKRLDMGYDLYCKNKKGKMRCKVYVPGSLHMYNGVQDKVSLSEAGRIYLINKGVSPEDLYGEDKNIRYRGSDGVYNSADECFVASQIWNDEKFSELITVCSPMQSMRKTAHYIAFGVFPSVFTCPSQELFHDYVYEMFTALPYVLYEDPYLDPKESKLAKTHRINRKFGCANA